MTAETHSEIANFIWSICNLLRGPYKRNEYRKVILPLTVLRRFDCILAPTKAAVLKEHAATQGQAGEHHSPQAFSNHRASVLQPLKLDLAALCSTTRTSSRQI